MADKVRDRLKELGAFLENEHAVDSVEESVEHLQRAVADCMVRSRALAQQATSYVFESQDPPSLIEFLDVSGKMSEDVRKKEISHARIKVLELLAGFVKTYGNHVAVTRSHIVETTRRCQGIARGDWSNKVRAVALEVVINVLQFAESRVTAEDIDPSAYVDKLYYDLKFSKATQTAKGSMLEVIGHVASAFPAQVEPKVEQLLPWIEDSLEKQFATNAPEMLLINGLLEALARLLVFDSGRYEGGKDNSKKQKLYTYLHRILATSVDGQLSRYQVTKSALQFLAIHAGLFRDEIGADAYAWFSFMKFCTTSENKTIKENAFAASDAVMRVVGEFLAAEKDESRKKSMNRLLKDLLPVLADTGATGPMVSFTMQCINFLASAIMLYLGEGGFLKIEGRLRKYGENLLILGNGATAMRWSVFSAFIQCIANFADQPRSSELDDAHIASLEDIIRHVLNAYPHCLWRSKVLLYKSILAIILAVRKQKADQLVMDRTVHHLLLLTVSNVTDARDMPILYHPETGNIETKFLYEFEDLWVAMLRGKKYTKHKSSAITSLKNKLDKNSSGESQEDMAAIRQRLLDTLLYAVFEMVRGLDLSYQYDVQEARAGSSSGGYKPNVPRDHSIMLNLTEFVERVVPRLQPEHLRAWVPSAMTMMFEKSRQLPLVSAFYRLTRVFALVADSLKIFDQAANDVDRENERTALRARYASFVTRVARNLRFYRDELLVATAGCVLATPSSLLSAEDYAKAAVPALLLGRSFLPAAELAISSLEKWQDADQARLETVFDRVIPCLSVYLEQVDPVSTEDDLQLSTASKSKDTPIQDAQSRSDWGKLQRRVVVFLGKAGGRASLLLSQDTSQVTNKPGRGLPGNPLNLSIKLGEALVDVSLSSLFNHIGGLACESTDRRVKASACEVYHALVGYLCGRTATHPHTSGSKSEYHSLWKAVFPVVLNLATDAEKICRSLFVPLLFQITRWFCHGSDTFPHEFSDIMDELVEGLSHETSTAIREISGKCLSTCLTSAVESTGAKSTGGFAKAEKVFQRLFSLCRHPGPAQRTGAATAISYFLRTLREDDVTVVQAFGLRCLKNFLLALKLCGRDARSGNADAQILEDMITKAIFRLQRAVVRYPAAFSQSKTSKSVEDSTESDEDNLKRFSEWLFRQCASRETAYRATCRQLFLAFTPIVSGTSCKRWIEDFAAEQEPIHRVLAPIDELAVLIHVEDRTNWNLSVIIDWLDQLTASAECYVWSSGVLGSDASTYLSPQEEISSKRKLSQDDLEGGTQGQLALPTAVRRLLTQYQSLVDFQRDDSEQLSVDLQLALQHALVRSATSVVELLGTSLKSTGNSFVENMLGLGDSTTQLSISQMLVQCIELDSDLDIRGDVQSQDCSKKIKSFCEATVHSGRDQATELLQAAASYVQEVTTRATRCEPTKDLRSILRSVKTINKLVDYGLLMTTRDSIRAATFATLAIATLDGSSVSPESRSLAAEAMQVAFAFGSDVGAMFDDKAIGAKLAVIYRELLQFFSNPRIWNGVSGKLVNSGQGSDKTKLRLTTLVELLSQVSASTKFPPRSSASDAFVETYAPHLHQLIRNRLPDTNGDAEEAQLLLEVLLASIPVLSRSSKRVVTSLKSGLYADIRQCVLNMLARREYSHFVKGDCLSVLAALGPSDAVEENQKVLQALAKFTVDEFPITSTDVKRRTRDYDIFQMLLGKLLFVVEESRSVDYLPAIYFALKEGDSHLFIDDIRASLSTLAGAVASGGGDDASLTEEDKLTFTLKLTDTLLDLTVDQNVRKTLLDYLFIPVIELQNASDLTKFYTSQVGQPTNGTMISKLATLIANSGEIVSAGAFLAAGVAFTLVEVLFRLIDPEEIRGNINNAFLGHANGKGREFTMLVCKCASKFATKSHDSMGDLTRFACWKAYNCLLTAVSRTQKQEKFFDQILFQESLWVNIVDVAREYHLTTETKPFDRVPLSSYSATTLRQQQRQDNLTQAGGRGSRRSGKDSAGSLRFFTGSSLSQASMTASQSLQLLGGSELAAREAIYEGIEVELDPINDHPCMIPLLRVLKQMKADFGDGWEPSAMPAWMKKIYGVVADPTTDLNIRLFLVKVVLDVPDVFERYSSMWADKMLDALLEATASSSSGKPAELHYLLRDCCGLLVDEWKEVDVTTMRVSASRFVNQLIELAPNDETNMIMQDNLLLITQLIMVWKSSLRIDVAVISKLLLSQDENPRREAANRYSALQVISAMLSAGLADELTSDFSLSVDSSDSLEGGILLAMEHKRPSIYNVAAEVSGLLLAAHGQGSTSRLFRSKLVERITKYFHDEDFGRFLALLRSVSLHDPSVIDSAMLNRLSFVLPKVVGIEAWSLSAVETLCNAAKNDTVVKELYTHCQPILARFLAHGNHTVQLNAVHLVEAMIEHVDNVTIDRLVGPEDKGGFNLFGYAVGQDDPAIRRVLINLAMVLFKKELTPSITEQTRQLLLQGLADKDSDIRKLVQDFWTASHTLRSSASDRLIELFNSFFAAQVADSWLLYATNLLLGMNTRSDSYDSVLFNSPLGEGEFVDAAIDAAWETKDQTMTPLFSVEADKFSAVAMTSTTAGSLASQGFSLGGSQADPSLPSQSQLIASSLASQDTFGSLGLSQGSFGSSQGDGSSGRQKRRRRFMPRTSASSSSISEHSTGKYSRQSDKNFFQERYAMQKKNEEAMLNRQRKARAQRVVMRRKYRVGEYPDIQIKLRDIIDPLMALCEMHTMTSSVVFAELVPAILTSKKTNDDQESLKRLGSFMEQALIQGKHSLTFVGAVHLAFFSSFMKDASLIQSIGISYKTVGASALASGSTLSGELILEEYLNGKVPESLDASAECWDLLYKILSTNQKKNLLVALSSQCCTVEESKVALQTQLSGDLPGAIASYRKAEAVLESELEMQPEDALLAARFELHRSTWERFACLEQLNHWDKLQREFVETGDSAFEFVWQEQSPYLERGIGHSIRSLLGSLGTASDDEMDDSSALQQLQEFLKKPQQDPARWETMISRFGVEMCLSAIVQGDSGGARVLVEQLYPILLSRWSATSKIAKLTRLEILQNLSSVVEIDEALRLSSGVELATSRSHAKQELVGFSTRWSHVVPSLGEGSMSAWSQFYMVQQVLMGFIQRTGRKEGLLSTDTLKSMHQSMAELMLRYAGAGVQNDILALASKYLKDYRELCNAEQLPKVSVLMVDVFVSHVLKLAERQAQKTSPNGDGLAPDAVNAITRYYQTSSKMFDNSDILELMEKLPLVDRVSMSSLEAKTFGTAAQFYMRASLDSATTEDFFTRAFDTFQRSTRAILTPSTASEGGESELSPIDVGSFARCRTTFIEFLVDILFSPAINDWTAFVDRKTMVVAFMDNILGGMACGDQECANYFPQLCEVVPAFPDIVDDFEKRVLTQIPIWTCLRWSSQLLALVNGPIGTTIVRILEKMAAEYPVALFYDFKITFGDQTKNPSKVDLSRLAFLVSNPVMEKFVDALRLIHHPELRLKEGLREAAKLLEDGKTAAAKEQVAHIWQDCFALEHPRLGGKIGHYNRDWARRAKRDVEKIMGKDGSNLTAKTVLAAREWISNNFTVIPGKHGITKEMKARLSDFAEWLDEFDHSKSRLELPGQYTTRWGKPDPASHVNILSIYSTLGVLASKQLPKQITLHCSDQSNYTFLVKGGEDLRLDQRIEQLFDVMNQILASHASCRDRNLNTKTYKVIPMTAEIGMIEWLHGTSTLKGIIERQLEQDPRCQNLQSNKRAKLQLFNTTAAKQYETFLMKQRGSSFAAKVAAPAREDVVASFQSVQELIPADLLRRQLLGLGADLEDFISIRDEFASSLAVFNACSYILGIGDRHLDNFLLDNSTGRVIGIDFGVSFGAGASVLPVPELIPFRFTRQMESVLHPYDSSNLMVQDMQSVFEALRAKKQVIESVMNVFLHEPLLDWQQSTTTHQQEIFTTSQEATQEDGDVAMTGSSMSASSHEDEGSASKSRKRAKLTASSSSASSSASSSTASGSAGAAALAWLPDVKVAIARRKLEGLSPRVLLKEELAQNVHLGKQLKHFQAMVDTAVPNGAPMNATAMSSLAQAQELMALATAPDILGRTYHGWMPWL